MGRGLGLSSPERTGLIAASILAALALCVGRFLGPRPLKRRGVVPASWQTLLASHVTHAQYLQLLAALENLSPLTTATAHDALARVLPTSQLTAITSDPAWLQGQHELIQGGNSP